MALLNFRKIMVFAVVLGWLAAPQSRGNGDYLAKTGPAPLRFSLPMVNVGAFTLPLALSAKPLSTNSTAIADVKTNSVEPAVTTAENPPKPAPTVDFPPNTPGDSQNNPPNPAPPPVAASDLLVVSPQMLTEFFKPGPGGSNSVIVPVVLPSAVGFTPPTEKPSSQAIYKSP
jgi:hypothetical protein